MKKGILKVDCPFLCKTAEGHQYTEVIKAGAEVLVHEMGSVVVVASVDIDGENRMFFLRPEDIEVEKIEYTKDTIGYQYYKLMPDGRYLSIMFKAGETIIISTSKDPGAIESTEEEFNEVLRGAKEKINELCQ